MEIFDSILLSVSQSQVTLLLLSSFVITFFTGPFVVSFCKKLVSMKKVHTRFHKNPTPTSGGILFVPVIIIINMILLFTNEEYTSNSISIFLFLMILCSAGIAILGFLDDKYDLNPRFRLGFHFIAAIIPIMFLPNIWTGIPIWIEKSVLLFGWVWFLNLYNFVDGFDGYATTEAVVISLVGAYIAPMFAPLFLVVGLSALGFLRVNFPRPRAKIFMGDIGSTFLGYTLGGLMFASLITGSELAFSFITIVALFAIDASFVLFKRFVRGENPLIEAHNEHYNARAYRAGFSHRKILAVATVVNVILAVIVLLTYDSIYVYISPFVGIAVFVAYAYFIECCERKKGIKPVGVFRRKA